MGKKARELGDSTEGLDNDKKKGPRQFDSPIKKTPTDEELEEALENSGGVQEAASVWLRKNKGIIYARSSISGRMKRNPKLKEAAGRGVEKLLDLGEVKLFEAVQKGNMTAIIFFLKCRGKKRGYIEKLTIGGNIETQHKENAASHLSDEELKAVMNKILDEKGS